MFRAKSLRFLPHLTGAFVLLSHTSSSTAIASHVPEGKTANLPEGNRVSAQSATPICTPIFGTGKAVGVPITVEDADGNKITNLSGYTFELTNGTDTQDVTSLIQTAEQQPLLVGQTLPAYSNYQLTPWGRNFRQYGTIANATGPLLDFSNPGYFFLGCTPDGTNASVKFPAGTTLNMKSAGTVVASVSVSGRSAPYMEELNGVTPPLTSVIQPAQVSVADFKGLYEDLIANVGVRFRPSFAAFAIMLLSANPTQTTFYCWDDLVTSSGGTWTWTVAGQDFIDELTSSSNTWPILDARTKGLAGPVHPQTQVNPCDTSGRNPFIVDYFINFYTAQLLLYNGPRGELPTSIQSSHDAFRSASLLQLARSNSSNSPQNNTSQNNNSSSGSNQTSATPTQNVAPSTTLPKTGGSPFGLLTVAALLLAGGIVLTTRRQTTPSFKF